MASALNISAGQVPPSPSQLQTHAQPQAAGLQEKIEGDTRETSSTRRYTFGRSPDPTTSSSSSILGEVPLSRPLTAAEKAREKKLREDPMVEVLSHLYVTCKLCKSPIKLSPKSTFDPFHWNKHRERCLAKKQGSKGPRKGRQKKVKGVNLSTVTRLAGKKAPISSPKSGATALTPPLTTDDDDDDGSSQEAFTWGSPSPTSEAISSSKNIPNPVHQTNLEFEDYLIRSQRHSNNHPDPDPDPIIPANWQTWNWNQLKAPIYDVELHHIYSNEGEDDEVDETDSDVDARTNLKPKAAPTCTLSFISESGKSPPDHDTA